MNSTTIRASVAPVRVGSLVFEGLMDEKGNYYIAQQQIAVIFSVIPTSAPKWLKANLEKGFQLFSVKTNRNKGTRQNRTEKALALPAFEKLLRKLDKSGNLIAESIVDDLLGLSLYQLFCDAFDIEFDKRDRQNWLVARQASKQAFWTLGDAIKSYKETHPSKSESYRRFIYSNCQDAINRGLFGKSASSIREELSVTDLLRDHYGESSLKRLDIIQAASAAIIVNQNVEPLEAVKQVLGMFNFEVINYAE